MQLCGIIDELEKSTAGENHLSYFFYQSTDSHLNNAVAVLRGLIYLLVKQKTSLLSHVREQYGPDGEALVMEANAWVNLVLDLQEHTTRPGPENVCPIINALHECETDLPQLLMFISDNSSAPRVDWVVSSRSRLDIDQQLKLQDSEMKFSLELTDNAEHVSRVVDSYIAFKVSSLRPVQDEVEVEIKCGKPYIQMGTVMEWKLSGFGAGKLLHVSFAC